MNKNKRWCKWLSFLVVIWLTCRSRENEVRLVQWRSRLPAEPSSNLERGVTSVEDS
jgi:hypothetical protein